MDLEKGGKENGSAGNMYSESKGTSLSMTSITLAQVDDTVMRFSKATFRRRELFKSIIIFSITNMNSIM